jgi:hypothetical protein
MMELLETIGDFLSDVIHTLGYAAKLAGKKITGFFKKRPAKKKSSPGFRIRDLDIYTRVRETMVRLYLKRTVSFQGKNSIITWQPLFFIVLKLALAGIISFLFFSLYPYLAGYLKEGILFFRFHEIFNFDFPSTTSLETLAQIILGIIIGYTGIFFIKYQAEALLSSLIISIQEKRIYYIRNIFFLKELYIFSLPEIDHVVLKQNIITRLLGIGTLLLQKKSGERVVIASLKNAPGVCTKLTSALTPLPAGKGRGE